MRRFSIFTPVAGAATTAALAYFTGYSIGVRKGEKKGQLPAAIAEQLPKLAAENPRVMAAVADTCEETILKDGYRTRYLPGSEPGMGVFINLFKPSMTGASGFVFSRIAGMKEPFILLIVHRRGDKIFAEVPSGFSDNKQPHLAITKAIVSDMAPLKTRSINSVQDHARKLTNTLLPDYPPDFNLAQTAARETKEETGLKLNPSEGELFDLRSAGDGAVLVAQVAWMLDLKELPELKPHKDEVDILKAAFVPVSALSFAKAKDQWGIEGCATIDGEVYPIKKSDGHAAYIMKAMGLLGIEHPDFKQIPDKSLVHSNNSFSSDTGTSIRPT